MPVLLTFEVFGEVQINRALLRVSERSIDAAPALEKIAEEMRTSEEMQFDTQGGSGSGGWAPLAASTVLAKERHNLDPRILHATLALRKALTEPSDNWVITPQSLTFNPPAEVFYGEFHMRGNANLPQRKPVDFTAAERVAWVKTLQRWVMTGELV